MKKKEKKKTNCKKLILLAIIALIIVSVAIMTIVICTSKTITYKADPDTTWCGRTCEVKDDKIATIEIKTNDKSKKFTIKPLKSGSTTVECFIKCYEPFSKEYSTEENETFKITVTKLFKFVIRKKIK
jgi:hypothetical protein